MRTLLTVTMDVASANKAIMDGSLPKIIQSTVERIKPEASYFFANNDGSRCGLMVFDMKDTSEIPPIAEPFFMGLNAKVNFLPVMNSDELQKGLGAWMSSQK